jgi:predicted DNA-binding transcriptional regulator AlpA
MKSKQTTTKRSSLFNERNVRYRAPHNLLDPCRLMKVNEVAAMLQIHPMTVWKWSSDGRLPKPVRLGPQTVGWRAIAIAALLDAKEAQTNEAETKPVEAAE